MKFLALEPFVPSGPDFGKSKSLFAELGFKVIWDAGDYVGFERDVCRFILQNYDQKDFAENFMVNVRVSSAEEFWKFVTDRELVKKFGIRVSPPKRQPYGTEVNIIDIAGVCWHFVE